MYSPDFINHFTGDNLERLKQAIQETRAAFSGLHIAIDEFIIEGDKSVARWTARSTHTGAYMGIPVTGKRVEQVGINIVRMVNGKIVEEWSLGDNVGLLRQLGCVLKRSNWGKPGKSRSGKAIE